MSPTVAAVDVTKLLSPSSKEPSIVDVPAMQFLMVDGVGNPNTSVTFQEAIQALYSLAYGAKFMLKKSGVEFSVSPLEALWGTARGFNPKQKAAWRWTAMIMLPDVVKSSVLDEVRSEALRKKPMPMLAKVRLETFHEGLSAEIMHIGPYSAEAPTIAVLHDFIKKQGHRLAGRHHEIYLGDPRRSAPERLRTVIRQPMRAR